MKVLASKTAESLGCTFVSDMRNVTAQLRCFSILMFGSGERKSFCQKLENWKLHTRPNPEFQVSNQSLTNSQRRYRAQNLGGWHDPYTAAMLKLAGPAPLPGAWQSDRKKCADATY
jgi:hypothetical protein